MLLLFRQLSEQRWRSRQSEEAARVTEQGNKGRPEELIFTAVGGNTRPAKISVSLKLLFCFVQLSTQWSVFCRQPGDMTMEHIKKVQINKKKQNKQWRQIWGVTAAVTWPTKTSTSMEYCTLDRSGGEKWKKCESSLEQRNHRGSRPCFLVFKPVYTSNKKYIYIYVQFNRVNIKLYNRCV